MQTLETNKHVACRWPDLVSRQQTEELCAFAAPAWKMHGGPPDLPPGPRGILVFASYLGKLRLTWTQVQAVIGEGDHVVVQLNSPGTPVDVCGPQWWPTFGDTFVFRIEHGRVREVWWHAGDVAQLMAPRPDPGLRWRSATFHWGHA